VECREIIKLAKRVSEQREQTSKDGPHLVAGLARRGSTTVMWPRESGTSGISPPSRSSRTSSLETDSGDDTDAAKSCT
jgi:hypothetical protein